MNATNKQIENSPAEQSSHSYSVPGDMLMDVLSVLVTNGIFFKITSVKTDQNEVILSLHSGISDADTFAQAVENVESMLDEYEEYQALQRPETYKTASHEKAM